MLTPAIADRVLETTDTEGTGTIALNGPVSRYRGFVAALGDSRQIEYTVVHRSANEWEVGVGTVVDGTPDTLQRLRVKTSSNSNATVAFSAGTKDVFISIPTARGMDARSVYLAAAL